MGGNRKQSCKCTVKHEPKVKATGKQNTRIKIQKKIMWMACPNTKEKTMQTLSSKLNIQRLPFT